MLVKNGIILDGLSNHDLPYLLKFFSYFPTLLLLQSELNLEIDLMEKAFATSTNAVTTVRRVIARSSFCNWAVHSFTLSIIVALQINLPSNRVIASSKR